MAISAVANPTDKMRISFYITPEGEQPLPSFEQAIALAPAVRSGRLPTPESPAFPVVDPQIFPDNADRPTSSSSTQAPLFTAQPAPSTQSEAQPIYQKSTKRQRHAAITRHRQKQRRNNAAPADADYHLFAGFIDHTWSSFCHANPLKAMETIREWSKEDRVELRKGLFGTRMRKFRDDYMAKFPESRTVKSGRVNKQFKIGHAKTASKEGRKPSAKALAAAALKHEATRERTVAPSREDRNFAALRDVCPPLSSLAPGRTMAIHYTNNPIDLSNDPHHHLLAPQELQLASNLRLDCATYLTTKRRMFIRRLECLRVPPVKDFKKTDAQKAGKIDVNKASKLWEAYNSVGWLDKHWMSDIEL